MPSLVGCLHPKRIINPYTHELQYVPCGKCNACLSSRAMKWTKRLQLEAQNWKYVYFITLTYNDLHLPFVDLMSIDAAEMDEELQAACVSCAPFINAFDGKVPCFSVRHLQLFMKRLRKKLYENEIHETHRVLRYFITCEYGPTGFRPHYHGILYCNSEWLSQNLEKAISEAWSDYSQKTSTFYPWGRIDAQRVSSTACQYVASYCCFYAHLPQILQHKWFRPFALFSKCPPLGSSALRSEQISTIFHNALPRMSFTSPDNQKVVNVRLWRFVENNLFPKCKGFDKLSHIERIALYGIYQNSEFCGDFQLFLDKFYACLVAIHDTSHPSRNTSFYRSRTFELIADNYLDRNYCGDKVFDYYNIQSLYKLWLLSRKVANNCNIFNVNLREHVELIERYYHNTALDNLRLQFQAEEDYLSTTPKRDISHLPYLIDPAFVSNDRSLALYDYEYIKTQFGVKEPLLDLLDSPYYKEINDYLQSEYTSNHKIRVKNEYLEKHSNLKKIQDAYSQCRSISSDLFVQNPHVLPNEESEKLKPILFDFTKFPIDIPSADFIAFRNFILFQK